MPLENDYTTINFLMRILSKLWGLAAARELIATTITSVVLYRGSVWGMALKNKGCIKKLQRMNRRLVLLITSTYGIAAVQALGGLPFLLDLAATIRCVARKIGRIPRMGKQLYKNRQEVELNDIGGAKLF